MQSTPILPVHDLDGAERFYAALGAAVERYDDGYAWVRVADREVLHLAVHTDLDPRANRSAAYLHVPDVDAVHGHLVAHGHALPPAADEPWGMREFTVRDPSGNLLRIGTPSAH